MEYRVVFDVVQAGYKDWTPGLVPLVMMGVGAWMVRRYARVPMKGIGIFARVFPLVFLGFATLLAVAVFGSALWTYWSLRSAVLSGKVSRVEGVVSDFKPMPYGGHAMEHFCVGEACFEYSDFVLTGGFNNTSSHGGPIREGVRVRVTHVDGTIVRLEVAQ
jgi:hypothetical protein